jgi:hypothetical protein
VEWKEGEARLEFRPPPPPRCFVYSSVTVVLREQVFGLNGKCDSPFTVHSSPTTFKPRSGGRM